MHTRNFTSLVINLLQMFHVFRYEHSLDIPDIQYAFDSSSVHDWLIDPANMSAMSTQPLSYYDAINVRAILLSPESRGFILLNETDPVWGPPLIYPRTFSSGWDLKIIVAGMFTKKYN